MNDTETKSNISLNDETIQSKLDKLATSCSPKVMEIFFILRLFKKSYKDIVKRQITVYFFGVIQK